MLNLLKQKSLKYNFSTLLDIFPSPTQHDHSAVLKDLKLRWDVPIDRIYLRMGTNLKMRSNIRLI